MDGRTYLDQVASELQRREWRTTPLTDGRLKVTNPAAKDLTELIDCRPVAGSWEFCWSWGDAIGLADAVTEVADRITHVLRDVGAGSR